jgi:hypothetical protein
VPVLPLELWLEIIGLVPRHLIGRAPGGVVLPDPATAQWLVGQMAIEAAGGWRFQAELAAKDAELKANAEVIAAKDAELAAKGTEIAELGRKNAAQQALIYQQAAGAAQQAGVLAKLQAQAEQAAETIARLEARVRALGGGA